MSYCVLKLFGGLKVNLPKLEIALVGDVPNLSLLAAILGCKASVIPISYLSLLLGVTLNINKFGMVW